MSQPVKEPRFSLNESWGFGVSGAKYQEYMRNKRVALPDPDTPLFIRPTCCYVRTFAAFFGVFLQVRFPSRTVVVCRNTPLRGQVQASFTGSCVYSQGLYRSLFPLYKTAGSQWGGLVAYHWLINLANRNES